MRVFCKRFKVKRPPWCILGWWEHGTIAASFSFDSSPSRKHFVNFPPFHWPSWSPRSFLKIYFLSFEAHRGIDYHLPLRPPPPSPDGLNHRATISLATVLYLRIVTVNKVNKTSMLEALQILFKRRRLVQQGSRTTRIFYTMMYRIPYGRL